jgi:16S rRNA G966 N2-methylase RsmD
MLIPDFAVYIRNMSPKVGAQPKWLRLTTFERTAVLPFVHRAVMFAGNVSFGFESASRNIMSLLVSAFVQRNLQTVCDSTRDMQVLLIQ